MGEMTTLAVDASLVRRLQLRDRVAWEELYTAYEPRLRRFAISLAGNTHDADDLVSETFVRVLPALDRLDAAEVNLEAYLFATTKNLFLKQVGRAKRTEPMADVPEPVAPIVPIEDDPERSTLLGAQQIEVRAANAALQPRQRMVLALCELEERSYAEIGEIVGLNENAVAQLVFRARESLRTELRLLQVDPESLPEECRAFLPALSQYLDGQLREPRKSATLAHLEGCERCQAALADMREAQKRYRTVLLPLGIPTGDANAGIERELEAAGYWADGGSRAAGRRTGVKVAAVVGAAVLFLAGGFGLASVLSDDGMSGSFGLLATTSGSTPASAETTVELTASTETATTAETKTETETATTAETKTETGTATATIASTETKTETAQTTPATTGDTETAAAPAPPPVTTEPKPVKDTTAPVISFSKAPPPTTPATTAAFTFASSEKGTTVMCKLDAGAWEACLSPTSVNGLALGSHAYSVRGKDTAGNTGSAMASWKVVAPPDTAAPTVSFTSAPTDGGTDTSASFAFSGSEPELTFTCSLDGAAFAACTSPAAYNGLALGKHAFVVRGVDPAGNVGEATHSWTIIAPSLSDLVVSALWNRGVTVKNVGNAASGPTILVVSGAGTFTIPGLAPGQSVSFPWTCKKGTLVATVDPGKQVVESDETNNSLTKVTSCLGFGT